MRPTKLSEVLGQDEIIGEGKILTEIVKKGEPVTRDAVQLNGFCAELFEEGLKL